MSADDSQAVEVERLARASVDRAAFERLANSELAALFGDPASGWGATQRVDVDGHRAFVKRVPLTWLELERTGSTANLYGIPPHLGYPFGSPGMNVWRELNFAVRSTGWVETGACVAFPILLHHRVMDHDRPDDQAPATSGYTAYRGDDPAMNRYLADRARSRTDLVLVYEDVARSASDWIMGHADAAPGIVEEVLATIAFIRRNGVVHFDVDLFNVLTDGRRTYLADHGLVMDSAVDLDAAERRFLDANRHFDDGNLILSLGHQLYHLYRSAALDRRAAIERELDLDDPTFEIAASRLLNAAGRLDADGLLVIGDAMLAELDRYGSVIRFMHRFFGSGRARWSSSTALDDPALARLLTDVR